VVSISDSEEKVVQPRALAMMREHGFLDVDARSTRGGGIRLMAYLTKLWRAGAVIAGIAGVPIAVASGCGQAFTAAVAVADGGGDETTPSDAPTGDVGVDAGPTDFCATPSADGGKHFFCDDFDF